MSPGRSKRSSAVSLEEEVFFSKSDQKKKKKKNKKKVLGERGKGWIQGGSAAKCTNLAQNLESFLSGGCFGHARIRFGPRPDVAGRFACYLSERNNVQLLIEEIRIFHGGIHSLRLLFYVKCKDRVIH